MASTGTEPDPIFSAVSVIGDDKRRLTAQAGLEAHAGTIREAEAAGQRGRREPRRQ